MKQFVKTLDKNGSCFAENIKAGILDGPQTRQHIKDLAFVNSMNEVERKAKSFVNFLAKRKAEKYVELLNEILNSFKSFGCNISFKVHDLCNCLDCFPEYIGDTSEEQGERFHEHIKTMETATKEDG